MSHFKRDQVSVKPGPEQHKEVTVRELKGSGEPSVRDFQFEKLGKNNQVNYPDLKSKFGPLADTDPERTKLARRDALFKLNEVSKGSLHIEEEENSRIEARVSARVEVITLEVTATAGKQGYEEGLKKGRDEAYQQYLQEAQEKLVRLEALITEFEGARDSMFQANEDYLMEVVFRIAKTVALKEIQADKDYVLRLARDLLEKTGVRENIRVKISKGDLELFGSLKQGLEQTLGSLRNLNIEASPDTTGGCIVETEWSEIDASVETQLNLAHDSLKGVT